MRFGLLRGVLPPWLNLYVCLRAVALACGALLLAAPAPAATQTPDPPDVIHQAANLVEWGRLNQARDLLAGAVNRLDGPTHARGDAPLVAYYSHVLMQFGDDKTGLSLARQAVATDPNCAPCHLYLFEALAQRAKSYGQVRGLLQLPKLKKQLEEAEQLDPNLGDVQWGWINLDLNLPASVGGGTKEALDHANRLVQIDPVDGNLARAQIYQSTKQPRLELEAYRAAAAANVTDPRGAFALGQALFERGDYAAAEAPLAKAWSLNHESALYAGYEAAELVHLARLPEARAVLDQAAKLYPLCRVGQFLVANSLKAVGQDFNWARELLKSYLEVPPEPGQASADEARALLAQLG